MARSKLAQLRERTLLVEDVMPDALIDIPAKKPIFILFGPLQLQIENMSASLPLAQDDLNCVMRVLIFARADTSALQIMEVHSIPHNIFMASLIFTICSMAMHIGTESFNYLNGGPRFFSSDLFHRKCTFSALKLGHGNCSHLPQIDGPCSGPLTNYILEFSSTLSHSSLILSCQNHPI